MIKLPNQQEVDELSTIKQPYCVSIYTSYTDPNTETNSNRIELKNILREAKIALLAAGVTPKEVSKTLQPAHALLVDGKFWSTQHQSLALFLHPKFFRYYPLPSHITPYILTIAESFNLEPLKKLIDDNKSYFVLALSHEGVQLYEGNHYQLRHETGSPYRRVSKLARDTRDRPILHG